MKKVMLFFYNKFYLSKIFTIYTFKNIYKIYLYNKGTIFKIHGDY